MTKQVDSAQLKAFSPIDSLKKDNLAALAKKTKVRDAQPGETLFREGDAEKRTFCDMQFTLQDRHYREYFPHAHRHVVLEAASAVGQIYVDHASDEIRILDIALVPAARGRGIGTRLLRNILEEADRTRRRVSLVTEPGNPARRLYARLGFIDRDAGPLHVEMVRSPS